MASNNQKPASLTYWLFKYKKAVKGNRVEKGYKYEVKYWLTDELVHANFTHARKFTPAEVGNMQDSVIYKKRLKLMIAKIKKEQAAKNS